MSNSSNLFLDHVKIALEDIIEEDDEGKSVTSKDYNKYDKRLKSSDKNVKILYKNEENEKEKKLEENFYDYDDDESFDFTEEEYLKIKKIKNKNIDNTNYMHLKSQLNDKNSKK